MSPYWHTSVALQQLLAVRFWRCPRTQISVTLLSRARKPRSAPTFRASQRGLRFLAPPVAPNASYPQSNGQYAAPAVKSSRRSVLTAHSTMATHSQSAITSEPHGPPPSPDPPHLQPPACLRSARGAVLSVNPYTLPLAINLLTSQRQLDELRRELVNIQHYSSRCMCALLSGA